MRTRIPRAAGATLLAALVLAAPAAAEPLAGTGENVEPIANLPISSGQTNELELAGSYAYVSSDDGLTIVDISDPANPRVAGSWDCPGGWGDVDISADATLAVVTNAHFGNCSEGGTAATLIDVSDKTKPRAVAKIDLADAGLDYVHTSTLDGKSLYLNPQVWAGFPQTKPAIAVFDISDPANPRRTGYIDFGKQAAAHDSYVDHRPDGTKRLYAASIHTTDVFDVTNPLEPVALQTTTSPEMTISHQAEPSFDRKMILVNDESAVDGGLLGFGPNPGAVCGRAGGPGPAAADVGSIHFYAAAPDGTFANGGLVELGSWNLPVSRTDETCTGHVFWTAPDEDRLTQAWYSQGLRILDFSDPSDVRQLGWFKADPSTMYWSAKPHNGYIYATDMRRGLDVLRYTGEGGARWPATAGPAEKQRAARQGEAYVPLG